MKTRAELTANELALAYELRQEGCCWKRIAEGLGCDAHDIRCAVDKACRHGLARRSGKTTFLRELLRSVLSVRSNSRLGWHSIAAHVGANYQQLRSACKEYTRTRNNPES